MMKDSQKLVSKCVYVNVLRATKEPAVLELFTQTGGWDLLNHWLEEAKTDSNEAFLTELLKVYMQIPITIDLLKKTGCAKTIKHISKSDDSSEYNAMLGS